MRHIKPYLDILETQTRLTAEQMVWLNESSNGIWEINPQTGLVDVKGFFECSGQGLTDFKGVRFGNIWKGFYCEHNSLTSLAGAPQKVGGSFFCSSNSLTTLEGAPETVDGDFYCDRNRLSSLEGSPEIVGGGFSCCDNYITSLDGAPQVVEGDFYCEGNPISEESMKVVLQTMSKEGLTLEEAVSKCWPDIPEEDRAYLARYKSDLSQEERRGYEALARLKKRVI
jgi:hypothetical protein